MFSIKYTSHPNLICQLLSRHHLYKNLFKSAKLASIASPVIKDALSISNTSETDSLMADLTRSLMDLWKNWHYPSFLKSCRHIYVKLGMSLSSCVVPVTLSLIIERKLMGNVCDTIFFKGLGVKKC